MAAAFSAVHIAHVGKAQHHTISECRCFRRSLRADAPNCRRGTTRVPQRNPARRLAERRVVREQRAADGIDQPTLAGEHRCGSQAFGFCAPPEVDQTLSSGIHPEWGFLVC
jgi:hypothetical protein